MYRGGYLVNLENLDEYFFICCKFVGINSGKYLDI